MLFVELDEQPRFELAVLLAGGDGIGGAPRWLAHAPHLDAPVEVNLAQLAVLQSVPRDEALDLAALQARHGEAPLRALLEAGLLLADTSDPAGLARDAAAREVHWWPQALLAHAGGAWTGVDVQSRREAGLMPSASRMVEENGPAPDPEHRRRPGMAPLPLPPPGHTDFDPLLARRRTCRNFDAAAAVAALAFSTMLHRTWGAVGTLTLAPGAVAVKKTSPAGGGLHAIEAYVLALRVEGLEPGLYHYLPMQHALEPMQPLSSDDAAALARRFVAGQAWFEAAPVLVVMTVRFDRLFWKYRRHAKAWRVAHLDAGHLSQTMYLSAADLGLGAFVTAAINDRDVDAALGLAPLREGAIALVGFGPRAAERTNIELDGLEPTPAARLRPAG